MISKSIGIPGLPCSFHGPAHTWPSIGGPRCCLVAKSYPTLLGPHGLLPGRLLCPWDSAGKNTRVGCHFLLQWIFPTQGSNPRLLHWQADSLALSHEGSQVLVTPPIVTVALSCSFNQSDYSCISVRASTQRNESWGGTFLLLYAETSPFIPDIFLSSTTESESYLDLLLLIYFTSKPVNLCCLYFCFFHKGKANWGLPREHSCKESACQCRRCRRHKVDPWVKKIPWSRKWLLTPVSLPGKSHGQRSLAGYRPRGHRESDMTEHHPRELKDNSWKACREPLPLASLEPNYSHSWIQKLRIVVSNPVNIGVISFLAIPNLLQILLLRNASLSHISNSVSCSNQRLPVSIP